MHTQLIASELKQMGFSTTVKNGRAIVGLKSRYLSTMEVKTALEQAFGEIEFSLKRIDCQKIEIS
jgi:hypothetical protein